MHKSTWHLRIALTSTAALMSVATALIIPQFGTPKYAIPEMSVPYHASAPQTSRDIVCSEEPDNQASAGAAGIESAVPVQVEIYSRDAAAALPDVRLNSLANVNCIHLSSLDVRHMPPTASTSETLTKAMCDQADAVAFKVE